MFDVVCFFMLSHWCYDFVTGVTICSLYGTAFQWLQCSCQTLSKCIWTYIL